MAKITGDLIAGTMDRLVRWVVVPVTSAIPVLISSGILLVVFAALWLGFGAALATNPSALDDTRRFVRELPLPIQGIAWLLLMPLLVGLWVWGTDWPLVVRLVLIAGIAGWNVLVFMPRRGNARVASVKSLTAPR